MHMFSSSRFLFNSSLLLSRTTKIRNLNNYSIIYYKALSLQFASNYYLAVKNDKEPRSRAFAAAQTISFLK